MYGRILGGKLVFYRQVKGDKGLIGRADRLVHG